MEEDKNSRKEKKKNKAGSIRSVFMYADRVDKWLMFLGLLGAMADGVSTPVLLFVSSRLMNDVGSVSSLDADTFRHSINQNALYLVYLACTLLVGAFLEGYCWTRTGVRQAARMRARYLKAVLRQEVSYFDLHVTSTSEVLTSVSNDTILIQDVIAEKVPNFLVNVMFFFSSYVVGFLLLWRLAIIGFPLSLLLVVPGLLYGRTLMEISRKIRAEYVKAETITVQAISSVRTVYAFTGEKKTSSEYSTALQGCVKLGLRQGLAKGFAIGSNSLVFAIWSFMAYYSSKMIMYHGAQGGTAYAVGSAITMGGVALGASLANVRSFSDACSAGERISEMIMRVPLIDPDNEDGDVLTNLTGKIEFRHVDFSYPSRPETIVFKGFCLSIPAEKTLALVGSSGSGKSTVILLLQRFYDPLDGEIMLDGVSIDKLRIKWLRSQLGLVSQEPVLFGTSIKENILFGKEDASMEEIVAAAKASNAHNFISQLPQGYDTQVGERGIQLSGGQKQRIAIARAIIKAPRILLLDEATSALDSESEKVVQEALDNASIGRTTIIVAHRLSTIRHADNIAVIQNGLVVESGSHGELIRNPDGTYTSLVNLQLSEKYHHPDGVEPRESQSAIMSSSQRTDRLSHSSRRHSRISHLSSVGSIAASHSSSKGDNNSSKKKQPAPSFQRLLALNLPEWKQAIVACISAILFGAVQPAYSFTVGSMIWVFFLKDHDEMKEKIKFYSLAFLGLAVFSLSINVIQHYSFAFMGENLTKRIREKMLMKVLTFEIGWFDEEENSSGSICSRLSKDASVVRSLVGDRMSLIVQTVSAIGFAFSISLAIAWRLSIVIIACQPVIVVCIYTRRVLLKSISRKAVKAQGESSKLAAEAVSNHRTITAFSSQDRVLTMLEKTQDAPMRESVRQSWYAGIGLSISQFMTKCILAFSFWYAGKLITEGRVTPKAFFETLFILLSTGRVIADAGSMTSDLTKGTETVTSVFNILDRSTKIEPEEPESYEPKVISGHVEFREIDFAYPVRPDAFILKGFSFMVEAGKSTALVGQSGSGKSTLVGLIERYYDPINGTVYIDGRDLRTYKLRSLRKFISLVSQEPTLFAGTIRENICYGVPEAQETEIVEAAKAANAHDFIVGLKDGYDTSCGDKGVQLSGGQKQRVAIARAVLRNPSLLLLDEATSALDTRSEQVVQNALERLMVGRMSLVIAHRLTTIQNCDVIMVLDNGKVVEKGSHSSLLDKGPTGAYYSLVNIQTTSTGGSETIFGVLKVTEKDTIIPFL